MLTFSEDAVEITFETNKLVDYATSGMIRGIANVEHYVLVPVALQQLRASLVQCSLTPLVSNELFQKKLADEIWDTVGIGIGDHLHDNDCH